MDARRRAQKGERQAIDRGLVARFGEDENALGADLDKVEDEARLEELITLAVRCRSLEAFRTRLVTREP